MKLLLNPWVYLSLITPSKFAKPKEMSDEQPRMDLALFAICLSRSVRDIGISGRAGWK